jgi:hypothetical protein
MCKSCFIFSGPRTLPTWMAVIMISLSLLDASKFVKDDCIDWMAFQIPSPTKPSLSRITRRYNARDTLFRLGILGSMWHSNLWYVLQAFFWQA